MDAEQIIDKDADKLVKVAAERPRDYSREYYKVGNFDFAIKFAEAAKKFDPDLSNIDIFIAAYRVTKAATPHKKGTNWYAVLDIQDPLTDLETIEKEYKRLDLMLGNNKIDFISHVARSLVNTAWDFLSDPEKRLAYDYGMGFRALPPSIDNNNNNIDQGGSNNNNNKKNMSLLYRLTIDCTFHGRSKPMFVYKAYWPLLAKEFLLPRKFCETSD